jgi:hypothetical protein
MPYSYLAWNPSFVQQVATLQASAKATNDPEKAKLAAELKLMLPANVTSEVCLR